MVDRIPDRNGSLIKIDDEDRLFRRIRAQRKFGDYEISDGKIYLTDNAFDASHGEPSVSVDIERLCIDGAEEVKNRLKAKGGENNGVAVLIAGEVRKIPKQYVGNRAVDACQYHVKNNPAHGRIYGIPPFTLFDLDLLKARLKLLANSRKLAIDPKWGA